MKKMRSVENNALVGNVFTYVTSLYIPYGKYCRTDSWKICGTKKLS